MGAVGMAVGGGQQGDTGKIDWQKCVVGGLSYWYDPRSSMLHMTGPCGQRHSMTVSDAKRLGEWLVSGVWQPNAPATLAARMAADPTQDWT